MLFLNIEKDEEIDIDNLFHIGDIRSVINVNEKFYVLSNKCDKLLGYYLIEIDENNPKSKKPMFLINWKSKLDIGDAELYLIENKDRGELQLAVSYKSVHINTYNILMVNLDTKMIEYRHESYHLWEANIRSILLQNLDCIIFSQDGMFIVNLGTKSKRIIQDKAGVTWMLHPLLSCTDLLLEDSNHLLFSN